MAEDDSVCSVLVLTLAKLSINVRLWLFVEFAFTQYYPPKLSLLLVAFLPQYEHRAPDDVSTRNALIICTDSADKSQLHQQVVHIPS